jgi:hypothetical protein
MRILVGESGEITTHHTSEEFDFLKWHVELGNMSTSIAHRSPDFKGAEGEIGPMILTAEAATNVMTATNIRNARGLETSRLANTALGNAAEEDGSEDVLVLQWQDRSTVQAVRSRLFIGLLEQGFRPGRTQTNPGEDIYNGLCVVEDVLRLPIAEATVLATSFNAAEVSAQ